VSDALTDMAERLAQREAERIEYALRGAVIAGYDGVDINRTPPTALMSTSDLDIQSIEPWRGEPPESDNGYRTERYTWHWFAKETLNEIARTGEMPEDMKGSLR